MALAKAFAAATVMSTLVSTTVAFNPAADNNLAVYYGQGAFQPRLSHFCQETELDIINLGFINVFPNAVGAWPGSNFGNQCDGTVYPNSQLLKGCHQIWEDIPVCKARGKRILLSIGGGTVYQSIPNEDVAVWFADFLWYSFGPHNPEMDNIFPRPFQDNSVDGFDFDIEHDGGNGYAAMINQLRYRFQEYPDQKFYISGAPQCVTPDAQLDDAIHNSVFDFIWVQFYNTPGCSARDYVDGTGTFTFDAWVDVIQDSMNPDAKLFLGLPASETATLGYYLAPEEVDPLVQTYMHRYPATFGGIMLWEATAADDNICLLDGLNYSQEMKNILLEYAPLPSPTSTTWPTVTPSPKPTSRPSSSQAPTSSASVMPASSIPAASSSSTVPSSTPHVSQPAASSSSAVVPSTSASGSSQAHSSTPVAPSSSQHVSSSIASTPLSSTPVSSPVTSSPLGSSSSRASSTSPYLSTPHGSVPVVSASSTSVQNTSALSVPSSVSSIAITSKQTSSTGPCITPSGVASSSLSAPVIPSSSGPTSVTITSSIMSMSSSGLPSSGVSASNKSVSGLPSGTQSKVSIPIGTPSLTPCASTHESSSSSTATSSVAPSTESSSSQSISTGSQSSVSGETSSSVTTPVITAVPSITPTPTSEPGTTTVIVTSYTDICPTGFTTVTITYTTTVCPEATATVTNPASDVTTTASIPEGWTTVSTVCTHCAPTPTTVTLTLPATTTASVSPAASSAPSSTVTWTTTVTFCKHCSPTGSTVTLTIPYTSTASAPETTPTGSLGSSAGQNGNSESSSLTTVVVTTSKPVVPSHPASKLPGAGMSSRRPASQPPKSTLHPSSTTKTGALSPSGIVGGSAPVFTGAGSRLDAFRSLSVGVVVLMSVAVFM